MTVSHTKAKFENFPSSGIKRVPGAKNMRKNRRKQVDERNLLCYNHQCRRICGCSSMARIPAFQAGRVGSIPITRSKRKVAVKRLFCFLKIRNRTCGSLSCGSRCCRAAACNCRPRRFVLLAVSSAGCARNLTHHPLHSGCCYSNREITFNNTLFFYFVSLMLLHLQLFLFVIIICRQLRKNVMKNALFVCLYPYFNFCTER